MNIYQQALMAQNACNGGGIINSLPAIVEEIRAEAIAAKGDWSISDINEHPVIQLIADKLVDLAGVRSMEAYSQAYDICAARAGA